MIKRLTGFFPLCAGFLLLAAGCGKKEAAPAPSAPRQVLLFGNGTEPQDLDPQTVTGEPEDKIITALFEGLVSLPPDDQGVVPGVAERWEESADGRRWTFHLRADAKWSDGRPVTAGDFVRSYQRILTPSLASENAYKLYVLAGAEAFNKGALADFTQVGVKAPDDRTLVLTLLHRTPFLLQSLKHYAWFPVPAATIEKFGGLARKGTDWTRPGNLVGNGPFVLESWRPNQKITVVRADTYWNRAAVKLDAIEFFPIENDDTEERMFRTGGLHRTNTLPLSKVEVYRREHPDVYRQDPFYALYFYRVNVTRPPLDDARVRRALALAIDREAIVRDILRGGQRPALNLVPASPGFASTALLVGDLAEARRLLAEAGYPGGKNFPRVELLFNTSQSHRVLAEAVQQMLKTRLGIDVALQNQEWKVYLDSQNTLNYQIARAGWIGDYVDPHAFFELWPTGAGNNQTGWSSPAYDRLLAEALSAPDETRRMALYHQMDQILTDELPGIPVYFYTRVYALSPKVKGWLPTPLDRHPYTGVYLEN